MGSVWAPGFIPQLRGRYGMCSRDAGMSEEEEECRRSDRRLNVDRWHWARRGLVRVLAVVATAVVLFFICYNRFACRCYTILTFTSYYMKGRFVFLRPFCFCRCNKFDPEKIKIQNKLMTQPPIHPSIHPTIHSSTGSRSRFIFRIVIKRKKQNSALQYLNTFNSYPKIDNGRMYGWTEGLNKVEQGCSAIFLFTCSSKNKKKWW